VSALLVLVAVREFQSYVVNPHIMGHSVGLSPLVTLVSVAVVSILFGGFAVILAVPFTSAVATLIDVFVLDHYAPADQARPKRRFGFGRPPRGLPAADQRQHRCPFQSRAGE
jgi:predicted PurR-regulated permease PerM